MTTLDRILAARALLEDITPLKSDCGRRCGAACCQTDADGDRDSGMLLFPGEEALYAPAPAWAELSDSGVALSGGPLTFITCEGECPRAQRPLACRVFPLSPIARDGAPDVDLDVRAWPICPLMGHGIPGLSRDFVAAVRAATALLWEDDACREYIEYVTGQLEAFRSF